MESNFSVSQMQPVMGCMFPVFCWGVDPTSDGELTRLIGLEGPGLPEPEDVRQCQGTQAGQSEATTGVDFFYFCCHLS